MRVILCLALLILAACGRPLTEGETAFLTATHGASLNTERLRLHDGNFASDLKVTFPVRPRVTCQERIWPPLTEEKTVTVSPLAAVVFNTILLRDDAYADDLMPEFPGHFDLPQAMLLAHEATHAWQWQNRARTGYHPLKGLGEHIRNDDPYLFDPDTEGRFLDYGYEQQGAIVEEYVCCRVLDPEAPRTSRLRRMLSQELSIDGLDAALQGGTVRLPWRDAKITGICR